MYDFSKSEISEPVKTIVWLLQNKPERFSIMLTQRCISDIYKSWRLRDHRNGKLIYVAPPWLSGYDPVVIGEDWMTLHEKMYLGQEVMAFNERRQNEKLAIEKGEWLEAYKEDIVPEKFMEEPELIEIKKPELTPLEKAAQEHTASLLAQREKQKDAKRMWIMGFLAGACLVIPLIVLFASR